MEASSTTGFRPGRGLGFLGVAPDELAGLSEIAQMLGVTKRTVQRYMARADWPDPVERLATGRVWRRVDIEAWKAAHLPLREGRPPKPEDAPST